MEEILLVFAVTWLAIGLAMMAPAFLDVRGFQKHVLETDGVEPPAWTVVISMLWVAITWPLLFRKEDK